MQTFTKEFKLTVVNLAESGRPTKELSSEYGVSKTAINSWRREYKNAGQSPGKNQKKEPTAEQKRISELEAQVKELALERDILKKALRIFSKND